jgi:hypothetical protein
VRSRSHEVRGTGRVRLRQPAKRDGMVYGYDLSDWLQAERELLPEEYGIASIAKATAAWSKPEKPPEVALAISSLASQSKF